MSNYGEKPVKFPDKEDMDRMRISVLESEISSLCVALEKAKESLENYGVHWETCILSKCSASEPTEGGGYRIKYGDKWYQTKPIDETPKCECGLSEAFSDIDKALK